MTKRKEERYIDILSDFGWKYYFGREENKINLIYFLNSLLEGEHVVVDLTYSNVEEDGDEAHERKVIMDLRCVGDRGEIFLVEMQLQKQEFFFDRAVSYTARTISRESRKGKKGDQYEMPPVYFIAVLGFRLDESNTEKYYYSGKIIDEFDHELLYRKLSYKMLVLPNFNKDRTELQSISDQWMYLMKHMDELDELHNYLDKRVFSRIFEIGELANLTPAEKMSYLTKADRERDYNNVMAYAKKVAMQQGLAEGLEKGLAEGLAEGRKEGLAEGREAEKRAMALFMKKDGMPLEQIAKFTKLSIEEVEKL